MIIDLAEKPLKETGMNGKKEFDFKEFLKIYTKMNELSHKMEKDKEVEEDLNE